MRRFFTDTRYFWLGCTQFPPCNYPVSRGIRLLYALELAYYLQVRLIWPFSIFILSCGGTCWHATLLHAGIGA